MEVNTHVNTRQFVGPHHGTEIPTLTKQVTAKLTNHRLYLFSLLPLLQLLTEMWSYVGRWKKTAAPLISQGAPVLH